MSGISLTEGQEEHEQGCQVTDKSPGLGFGAHSPTSPSSHPTLRSSGFTDPYIRGSSLHLQVTPLLLPQYRPEGGPRWVLEAGPEKAKGGCGPCPAVPTLHCAEVSASPGDQLTGWKWLLLGPQYLQAVESEVPTTLFLAEIPPG